MTKAEALYNFWSGFGLLTYDENAVPTGDEAPAFPYLTYQLVTDSYDHPVTMTASIWDRDADDYSANAENNARADSMSRYIGMGGSIVPFDGGAIWITRGHPFAQSLGDPSDNKIKRKLINITAEFISNN